MTGRVALSVRKMASQEGGGSELAKEVGMSAQGGRSGSSQRSVQKGKSQLRGQEHPCEYKREHTQLF